MKTVLFACVRNAGRSQPCLAVAAVLVVTAVRACAIPAWPAARLSPTEVLRAD